MPAIDDLIAKLGRQETVTINRNTVVKKIGEGAFAYVFECHFDKFGRKKGALKLPKNEDAKADIETRKIILSALGNSPFSTDIIDQGEHNGVPYVVEEFRERTLANIIEENAKKGIKPSAQEIVTLGKQLLTGIDYFHRLGETDNIAAEKLGLNCLIHNDIKPSNILEAKDTRTGQSLFEYTDFGIRINTEGEGDKKIVNTVSRASLESIRNHDTDGKQNPNIYASPEVRKALFLQETPPATVLSDLWSIGAVLFAYATGKAPEWGESELQRNDLPPRMNTFFKKMLDGNPAKRHQTAKEALKDLEQSILDESDSHIIGFGRKEDGKYSLFHESISKGKPIYGYRRFTATLYAPKKMVYVPELRKVFVFFSYDDAQSICVSVYDIETFSHEMNVKDVVVDGKIIFGNNEKGKSIKKYEIDIVRREDDSKVALRGRAVYKDGSVVKRCYDLPSFTDSRDEGFDETRPGWFSKWKKVNETSTSIDDKYLQIESGLVRIMQSVPGQQDIQVSEINFDCNILYIAWVKKI